MLRSPRKARGLLCRRGAMKPEILEYLKRLKKLRYLFHTDREGRIVAHCLDFDVVASALDREEASRRLDVLVRLRITLALINGDASQLAHEAPRDYVEMYERGKAIGTHLVDCLIPLIAKKQEFSVVAVELACAA